MKEQVGVVFSIARDNPPVAGCTISKAVQDGADAVVYFSLAPDTDISPERHPFGKLVLTNAGSMEVYDLQGFRTSVETGCAVVLPADGTFGMKSDDGAVYTEIALGRNSNMNKAVKAGEVFRLADLVPYQDGRIVNMDVVHNDTMKFVVMAFDGGTGLSEHAAPGEAIVFGLDGEGVIGYEGKEHVIKAGENFHFAKGGLHSVRADKRFKMALLLTLA